MPRIPYVTDDEAGDGPLVQAIRTRRGGKLLKLDRQLLHRPPFANGWNTLLAAVRSQMRIAPQLRELALVVVAVLTGADDEIEIHVPEFVKAGGSGVRHAGTSPRPGGRRRARRHRRRVRHGDALHRGARHRARMNATGDQRALARGPVTERGSAG